MIYWEGLLVDCFVRSTKEMRVRVATLKLHVNEIGLVGLDVNEIGRAHV